MKKPDSTELFNQATRQRETGSSYLSIGQYLNSTGANEKEIAAILKQIDDLEKNGGLKVQNNSRNGVSFQSGFMGGALIFFGVILTIGLWNRGWVSMFPIILIGAGLGAFTGVFK